MVPQIDLVRVQRSVDARNERIPDSARDLIRNDIDVTDRSITIVECRPPWNPDLGPEWTRSRMSNEWSLYWIDRKSKFHPLPSALVIGAVSHSIGLLSDRCVVFE
jgi:hypothetical protein